jgi:hypothetical protein
MTILRSPCGAVGLRPVDARGEMVTQSADACGEMVTPSAYEIVNLTLEPGCLIRGSARLL